MEPVKNENKESLSFTPLHKGLGFHPFSDGLPYAPQSKSIPQKNTGGLTRSASIPSTPALAPSSKSMGTGAVAAGAPRFTHGLSVNIAPASKTSLTETIVAESLQPKIDAPQLRHPKPASLWKRFFAFCFDTLFTSGSLYALISLIGPSYQIRLDGLWEPDFLFYSLAFFALWSWGITSAQDLIFSTSLGKKFFGIHLAGSPGGIFIRSLLLPLSIGLMGLGTLSALFDSKKRCLHDLLTGVWVEE